MDIKPLVQKKPSAPSHIKSDLKTDNWGLSDDKSGQPMEEEVLSDENS